MKTYTYIFAALLMFLAIQAHALSINTADLNTNARAGTQVKASASVQASTTIPAKVVTAKARANQEIDRRVTLLNEMVAKVSSIVRLSAEAKANLSANLNSQVGAMQNLKAKIELDTDSATLKTDVQSITKSYRIFMLIIPQARVAATADAISTTVTMMTTLGTKFQTRLMALENNGKDTTPLLGLMDDFKLKLLDAKAKADAAVSVTASLQPDNGDKATIQKNNDAFAEAKADLKAAQADLKAAREDAEKLLNGIRTLSVKVNVTSTATTTVQ